MGNSCTSLEAKQLPLYFRESLGIEYTGIVVFTAALIYLTMSFITVAFIKSQEFRALEGNVEATQSVIFPVFVKVLWVNAFVSLISALIITYSPLKEEETMGRNTISTCFLQALMWAFQHMVIEGIAFLLLQKGCGTYAAIRAFRFTISWGALTFFVTFCVWYYQNDAGSMQEQTSQIVFLVWNIVLLMFYSVLWKAPPLRLYRRPALYIYARYWFCYRFAAFVGNIMSTVTSNRHDHNRDVSNCGNCIYIILTLFINPILIPLISYVSLLQDSRWWQGESVNDDNGRLQSYDAMKSPLLGTDFTLASAQVLAEKMDQIRSQKVKILNFARIKIDLNDYLGAGSFSKVYKGYYRGQQCAIKLIYTFDLTTDVINRVAAESSILSSIRHNNVVSIVGVSILPPSVCLLLELCSFGSLSDIIRGYGFDWNSSSKLPMTLSYTDKLYLALGCARGLAAVHNYDRKLCHRDVKSFNFLVDSQFNAKIADLELGIENFPYGDDKGVGSSAEDQAKVDEMLANWMAPEVVKTRVYEQASDVYSLGLVFWEIISGQLPFDNHLQPAVRMKLMQGFRHSIPVDYINSPFAGLIKRAWSENPAERPSANEIVAELEIMIQEICYRLISDTDCSQDYSHVLDYYEKIANAKSPDDNLIGGVYNRKFLFSGGSSDSSERNSQFVDNTSISNVGQYLRNSLGQVFKSSSVEKQVTDKKVAMSLQMPRNVNSSLLDIHMHDGWIPLDESGLPWAVFSPQAPHILVHTTEAWRHLFGVDEEFHTNTVVSIMDLFRDMSDFEEIERMKHSKGSGGSIFSADTIKKWLFGPREGSEAQSISSNKIEGANNKINNNDHNNSSNNESSSKTSSKDIRHRSHGNNSHSIGSLFSTNSLSGFQYTTSSKINSSYIDAASRFLSKVNDNSEAHGLVPITRQLGRAIDSMLCSLHCYPIYPKRPIEPVMTIYTSNLTAPVADNNNSINNNSKNFEARNSFGSFGGSSLRTENIDSKDAQSSPNLQIRSSYALDAPPITTPTPAYIVVLFNELKDQAAPSHHPAQQQQKFASKAKSVVSDTGNETSGRNANIQNQVLNDSGRLWSGDFRPATNSHDSSHKDSRDAVNAGQPPSYLSNMVGRFWSAGSVQKPKQKVNNSGNSLSAQEDDSLGGRGGSYTAPPSIINNLSDVRGSIGPSKDNENSRGSESELKSFRNTN